MILFITNIFCHKTLADNMDAEKEYPQYSVNEFLNLVDSINTCPPKVSTYDTTDIILLVRIYNTIGRYIIDFHTNESLMQFADYFSNNYLNVAVNILDAEVTRGLGYYSKKYDLYIGGSHINDKSYIHIEQLEQNRNSRLK